MLIVSGVLFLALFATVLIIVLKKVLDQNVVHATQHLDELNQDYLEKGKQVEKALEEAKLRSEQIIVAARQEAEKIKFDIISHAEKESEGILSEARRQGAEIVQQADKSRHQLLSEIEERIAKGAVAKSCELIESTLPEEFKKVVHEHWLDELIGQGFGQLSGIQIPQDTSAVNVTSAYPLTEPQRKKLVARLHEVLGRELEIKEELNPHTIAGVVITVGSLVLDGSLKNKIQEQSR